MATLLKFLTLRNPIFGMGKKCYGIWSEGVRQTVKKAIEAKLEKIVKLPDKEHQQKAIDEINKDFAKMITEQYRKMAKQNAKMEERKKASVVIPDNSKMGNLDNQAIKVNNPSWNRWDKILIQLESDYASTDDAKWHNVFAFNGFPISREHSGSGTDISTEGKTIYYYEVIVQWGGWNVMLGLSGGLPADYIFGDCHPNFYYLSADGSDNCCLSGTKHEFELPTGAIKPEWKNGDSGSRSGDVIGCGILLHSNGKLFIFFTLNGNLMGKPIPIKPSVDRLYPTVRMALTGLEANFGYDPAIPFTFDIGKCADL